MSSTMKFELAAIPKTPDGDAARSLIQTRNRLLKNGQIIGIIATAVLVIGALMLVLSMGNNSGMRFSSMGLMVFVYAMYSIFSNFSVTTDKRVLILRPFGKFDKKRFNLPKQIGLSCRGLAIPFTVQDHSFRYQYPGGSEIYIRNVHWGISLIGGMLVSVKIELAHLTFSNWWLDWIIASVIIFFVLRYVIQNIFVYRGNRSSYKDMIKKFMGHDRRKVRFYNGVKVYKLDNDIWQDAVEEAIKSADAILIDISNMTDNVIWEVGTAFRNRAPESIILCWEHDKDDEEKETVDKQDGDKYQMKIPDRLQRVLSGIAPEELTNRCEKFSYPREDNVWNALAVIFLPGQIANCIAYSDKHYTRTPG